MTAQLCQALIWNGVATQEDTETSTVWKETLPEAVGAGNRILLALTYPSGNDPTITDNNGNSWPGTPTVQFAGGNCVTSVWDLLNANAGVTTITFTFPGALQPVTGEIHEYSGLSTSAANKGTSTAYANQITNPACGTFTPTNNDANGGNLIVAFFHEAWDAGGPGPTSWTAGSGFSLMHGNCLGTQLNAQGLSLSSEYGVQATSAAINPGVTCASAGTAALNCVAIALPLSSGAGTPPSNSLRIVKTIKFHNPNLSNVTSANINFPTVGNFRAWQSMLGDSVVTAISDSDGAWTDLSSIGGTVGAYYAKNKSANPTNLVTFTIAAAQTARFGFVLLDIANAATSTVIGATASNTAGTTNGQTTISDEPDITPTQAGSIVLAAAGHTGGPVFAPSSPAGARSSNVVLSSGGTGETAGSGGLNVNASYASYRNSGTSPLAFNWSFKDPGGSATFFSNAFEVLPGSTVTTWQDGAIFAGLGTLSLTILSTILADPSLDGGLLALGTADHFYLCSAQPATYTDASSTFALGNYATTVFGAPAPGSPSGRQVSAGAISTPAGAVTSNGTAAWWAATSNTNSSLLALGTFTSGVSPVSVGQAFAVNGFTVTIPSH